MKMLGRTSFSKDEVRQIIATYCNEKHFFRKGVQATLEDVSLIYDQVAEEFVGANVYIGLKSYVYDNMVQCIKNQFPAEAANINMKSESEVIALACELLNRLWRSEN